MRFSATKAMQTRLESRKLSGFGKTWASGDTVNAFYPIYKDPETGLFEILASSVWGHSIDPKIFGLKRIFIPTNSEIIDGEPTVADSLYQFSRLAPLFIKGEYNDELEKVRKKAERLTEAMRKQKETELDKDYQVKDGRIGKSAAVGNLRLVVTTEVVVVKQNDEGRPKTDTATIVTQDLSNDRIRNINQILNDKKSQIPEDAKYLEVTYTFGTTGNRSQDAQVKPIAVMPEYRIEERYPQEWLSIKSFIDTLPVESETIEKRNPSYKRVPESEVKQAINTYAIMNSELLDYLQEDEDITRLKRNADLLRLLAITVKHDDVMNAVNESEKVAAAEAAAIKRLEDDAVAKGEAPVEKAPTMADLIAIEDIETARESDESDTAEVSIGDETLIPGDDSLA